MPSNFEQLVFEIIATDRSASAAFDKFRQKVDQTSRSVEGNTSSLDKNAKSIDNLGKTAAESAGKGGLADLIGSGSSMAGGGMAGLIAAGVALSPMLVTIGTGLGGLGLAAYGAVKPIEQAAQKTGGLKANMSSLNPEQQKLAFSLLGLQKQYGAFQKALQPQVLSVFGKGIELAGHLMSDVQPVATATGKAIGGFLDRVDAEFQSGTWKSFFSWMSAQVGPDIKLIGTSVVDLLDALPPLLQSLQPVALQLMHFVDDGAKLIDMASRVNLRVQDLGHTADTSGGLLGRFAGAAKQAFNELAPGVQGSQLLEHWLNKLGNTTNTAAAAQMELNKRVADSHAATADLIHPLGTLKSGLQSVQESTHNETMAVQGLTNALKGMGSGLLTTQQDQITWRQAQEAATKAIQANSGSLDSNKSAALAARSAIIQSTQWALAFAQQEANVHHNTDAASQIIRDQIRWLQDHAGKSRAATQEVQALRAALQKLQGVGPLHESISMTGRGTWGIFGKNPVNSGLFNAASGGRVPGAGTGDTVPAMLTPGEAVVPKRLVPMVAPFLRANQVPGFASGGIIPDYMGGTGRPFVSWMAHDWNASLLTISNSMAAAIQHAVGSAINSAAFTGGGGPGGGAPAANAALARRMYPAWGSGAEWAAWNAVAMRESGWNQFARNPSSGAYGIAQALPPTKYPFAGQAAGGSNPRAQIGWMIGYIASRYGDPITAAQHEAAFGWYDHGGYLPPGYSVAYNGTGKPERVGGGSGTVINVNVQVGHGTNPVAAAQEIVRILNHGAKSGVKLRTSILGPG